MKPATHPVVLAVALAAALPAAAQPNADMDRAPDKILTLGDGPQAGAVLSREQLDECLGMQPKLKTEADKARRLAAEVEQDKAEFDRFDNQLKAERSKVDPKNRAEIAAYNAKLEKRQKMVVAYNAKSDSAAKSVEAYNALAKSWGSGCENRPYKLSDYAALRPVKGSASEPARTELRVVRPEGK
ncbi:MAG TPA: hypothetical protein VLU41_12695 [Ideonella sp.]|nr:hypothetical protein [Ideonella sp.]